MDDVVLSFVFFWFCVSGFGSTSENEILWGKLKSEILQNFTYNGKIQTNIVIGEMKLLYQR